MLTEPRLRNTELNPYIHTGEVEEGGTSCTPSKYFEKLDHKNAIKD
jgi:hypothetical protein